MKTYIRLKMSHRQPLPAIFRDDDIRYPESLVEHFLEEYTHAGDVILDPFAGFGTTLLVAERMGRNPFGVEIDQDKVDYVRSMLSNPENIIHGDSLFLADIELPPIDFSMTSPPYMTKDDHSENPLTGNKTRGYQTYLRDIRSIYGQLREHMKPSGTVVVEVSNLKVENRVTPLAWDIGREISRLYRFEGEVIACWDKYGYGYDHSYCLVFTVK
jgi:DNA modification methylase